MSYFAFEMLCESERVLICGGMTRSENIFAMRGFKGSHLISNKSLSTAAEMVADAAACRLTSFIFQRPDWL